ncbi:MAG: transglutaminase domain-containing protein [Deltaproteobacteria bacterium]|nr:transglutaminase domain-containing protein [Deltaproteobacteria bacterium]
MLKHRKKPVWIATVVFALLFGTLFSIRAGLFFQEKARNDSAALSAAENFSDKNTWMNIFQNDNKIGFSHSSYARTPDGFRFHETVFMRINTMGMIQDISLKSNGLLNMDFSLASFSFEVSSGRFDFIVDGSVSETELSLTTGGQGSSQNITIPLKEKIYFTSGIVQAASAGNLKPGDRITLKVFDPVTMGQESIVLSVLENEEIQIMGSPVTATRISLQFKGSTQLAWIDASGDILKETGMLGISLEKTTREEAMYALPVQASQDLTDLASIPANIDIRHPESLTLLRAKITGITDKTINLRGGRQKFVNGILTVHRESLDTLPTYVNWKMRRWSRDPFLKASPFIQSNHPEIIKLATDITLENDLPLEKARKLMAWIEKNIQKRPVLSLPDAISTLENRIGDCNEHAVLFAAMARAVHIPAKVEAGIVYLNGRFYYHAWNLIDVGFGQWITVDALFNQIPADVTHIRLAGGAQEDQLDILGLIGKLGITILEGTE